MATLWTPPATWDVDQLVTNEDLNDQLRDNLLFLKDPPTDEHTLNEASNYTTTSTSFVDVDATNLALEIETAGGDIMFGFCLTVYSGNGPRVHFDVELDGVRIGGDDGLCMQQNNGGDLENITFIGWKLAVDPGSHTLKLQWKTDGTTATLYAGAGTANRDVHPQFWVREVS